MKLYRSNNGQYAFRSREPQPDLRGNFFWHEVEITFSDDWRHVRLFPVGNFDDRVTLSFSESRIFRLQPAASQALLQQWFCIREPDRALIIPDYLEADERKATYAEWGGREARDKFTDFSEERDCPKAVSDGAIVAVLRAKGELP